MSWQEKYTTYTWTIPTGIDLTKAYGGMFSNYTPGQTLTIKKDSSQYKTLINTGMLKAERNIPAQTFTNINSLPESGAGYSNMKLVYSGSSGTPIIQYTSPDDGSIHRASVEGFLGDRNITVTNLPKPDPNQATYYVGDGKNVTRDEMLKITANQSKYAGKAGTAAEAEAMAKAEEASKPTEGVTTPTSTGTISSTQFENAFKQAYGKEPTTTEFTQWANAGRPSDLSSLFGQSTTGTSTNISGMTPTQTTGTAMGAAATAGNYTFDYTNYADLPDVIKNSDAWKNGTDYDKLMLYTTFKARQVNDPQIQTQMMEALGNAMSSLDPYYKMKTRLAVDEIERSVGTLEGDFASKNKSLQDKIKALNEDLTFNKDYLSLEQQSELANQKRQYENELYSLQQNAAETGLAFSSPRARAEQQLSEQNQGIVESTNRRYNKSQRDLQLGTERDLTALQQNIADYERQRKEGLTNIQRAGEEQLGSTTAPKITGVTPLGGIQGTLEQEKQAQALNLGQNITNYFSNNI